VTVTDLDGMARQLADPTWYADDAKMNATLAVLRDEAPVVWVDHPPYRPFWAITKHADILDIERDGALWLNGPRPLLQTAELDDSYESRRTAGTGLRNLTFVDGQEHRRLRAIGAEWFRPKVMRTLKERIDDLAARYVDQMMRVGPTCEFVGEIATAFPGYVILSLLGLPEDDYALLLRWTQELFGLDDEQRRRGARSEDAYAVVDEFIDYFRGVTAARRSFPSDDLSSAIANARVDGELISDIEAISYYQLIASAGHDTTKAAIAGGMLAFIEHPAELQRLRDDPTLMPTAVDEVIRWSTPVKSFMRTAARDTSVRGIHVTAGQAVCLMYSSANRDAEAFDDPTRFDVGRKHNRHLGFGAGVHYCLGAGLARMEIDSFFRQLIPRLRSLELAGPPRFSPTTFVGGLTNLPIRYRMQ